MNTLVDKIIRVSDIMTTQYTIVEGKDTLSSGLEKMKELQSRIMIVNKRHENDEYGLISMSDIANKVLAANKNPERTNLYEIMTKPVVTVHASMDIRYCAQLMSRFKLALAPVCNETGTIIGLVDFDDMIFKGLMKN